MSKQLFINDQEIDLDEENNPIANTFAVNNLSELKDRQAYGTNNFKVPKTKNNQRILGFPDVDEMITKTPYRKNKAKIVQNGFEIVQNGVATIKDSGEAFYNIQVISGIKGFFDTLGDVKLNELDFDRMDHVFEPATILASQTRQDYVYPIINYGQMKPVGRVVHPFSLRPAMFEKEIFRSIEMYTGFKLVGDIFNDGLYKSEILPFSLDKFVHSAAYMGDGSVTGVSYRRNSTLRLEINTPAYQSVDLWNAEFPEMITDTNGQFNGSLFTASSTYNAKISSMVNTEFSSLGSGLRNLIMRIVAADPGSDNWYVKGENILSINSGNTSGLTELRVEAQFQVKAGTRIRTVFSADIPIRQILTAVEFNNGTFEVTTAPAELVEPGDTVQMSATLPDMTAKDFIKDFLQRKGLTVIPKESERSVLFSSISRLYINKNIAVDWTEKLRHKTKRHSYSMSGYGVNNYGRFKADDTVPDGLGDGFMKLDNLAVDKEDVDLFKSVFAATEITKVAGENFVPYIKKQETRAVDDNRTEVDYKIKTQPRILISRVISSDIYITDALNPGNDTQYNNVPYFDDGTSEGLSYVSVFKYRYADIQRMLNNPLIVKVKAKLNEIDILNLDWEVPIYDGVACQHYYLNEINSFVDGELTDLTLIRL